MIQAVFLASWRPYAWLFALAVATYARTLGFGFSPLDDRWMIVDRLDELKRLPAATAVFTHAVFEIYYRPLLELSFVIDAVSGRGGPLTFHLTNVVLHGLVCVTLFTLLRKLEVTRGSAFFLSALFAVHPVHVHAVAWIPGRNDVLLTLFVLGAAIAFFEYLPSRAPTALAAHVGLFALALLTKESAYILPLVLLSYALCPGTERIRTGLLIPAWAVVLALWGLAWRAIVEGGASIAPWNLKDVAIDAASGLVIYCGKLVLPVQQAVFPTVQDSSLLPGLLTLAAGLVVISLRGFYDKRKAAFGAAWFLLFLAPPLLHGASDAIGEHYEHRLYLPAIGALIVVSQLDWGAFPATRRMRLACATLALLAMGALFAKAVYRSGTYRDARSIAEAGVRESPNLYHAYGIRATVRSDAGQYDLAIADFDKAFASMSATSANRAKLELLLADARVNFGNELSRVGRLDEAVDQYLMALRIRPRFAKAHNNLGVAFMRQRRIADGAREFTEALRIEPDYPGARQNLERARKLLGDPRGTESKD